MISLFFNYTVTTEIYTYLHTLSLHDALPILFSRVKKPQTRDNSHRNPHQCHGFRPLSYKCYSGDMKKFAVFDIDGTLIRWQLYHAVVETVAKDRKSTRLNSSN